GAGLPNGAGGRRDDKGWPDDRTITAAERCRGQGERPVDQRRADAGDGFMKTRHIGFSSEAAWYTFDGRRCPTYLSAARRVNVHQVGGCRLATSPVGAGLNSADFNFRYTDRYSDLNRALRNLRTTRSCPVDNRTDACEG